MPLLRRRSAVRVRLLIVGGAAALATLVALAVPAASTPGPQPPMTSIRESNPVQLVGRTLRTYPAFDADQGVAVDGRYFYSVDNFSITKHDRRTGKALRQWYGGEDGPIIHLDGAAILGGVLVAAHSNYPEFPEASSVETWDPVTMRHLASHSFGIERGSMTWIDRYKGSWWATFANYDKVQDGQTEPYGLTANTQLVQMDNQFRVKRAWIFPADLQDRFRPMSNSGGSWGPDGRLYLTGHDNAEAYVVELPAAGPEVRWVATVALPAIAGQGIAWDRSGRHPTLWGISRDSRKVVQLEIPLQSGSPKAPTVGEVLEPGEFVTPN